jgi:YVTN family beta-propeller protein
VNKTILQTIQMPSSFPGVVVLTPDGSQAWVNYYNQSVVDIIDVASGTISGHLNFGADTENGIAFNSTGTKAFVAVAGSSQLAVVNTATLATIAMIPVANEPVDVVYNPQDQTVLVASITQGQVSQVDAVANKLLQNFTTGAGGIGLSIGFGNLPWGN